MRARCFNLLIFFVTVTATAQYEKMLGTKFVVVFFVALFRLLFFTSPYYTETHISLAFCAGDLFVERHAATVLELNVCMLT